MKNIHVLITLPLEEKLITRLQAVSPQISIHMYPARGAEEIPKNLLPQVEVLYTMRAIPNPELTPNLRWIQLNYPAIDFKLDQRLLDSDIQITTLSGATAPQMAEYALMGMMALGHRIPAIMKDKAEKHWDEKRLERFCPSEFRDSTIGIIGYESVGREIARLARACGANVLAAKCDMMQLEDQGYMIEGQGDPQAELVDRIYPIQAIGSMAALCDFLVITLPLTVKTRGKVDERVFKCMKPSAYLIDVSSGGVVDHGALVEALAANLLAGAMLDVYPVEPLPESSPLWEMPNVILSPHIAETSTNYIERAVGLFAANLQHYLEGKPLFNRRYPEME